MIKNLPRPSYDNLPETVGEMSPKQLFNHIRYAIAYECQESSTFEEPTWRGSIFKAVAGLFSSPNDNQTGDPNIDTVYAQLVNITHAAPPKEEQI